MLTIGPNHLVRATKAQTYRSYVMNRTLARSCRASLPRRVRSRRAGKLIEPPAFEAEVKAGKLPPIAKRLPENPLVVKLPRREAGSTAAA
jgi:hypothetical protein